MNHRIHTSKIPAIALASVTFLVVFAQAAKVDAQAGGPPEATGETATSKQARWALGAGLIIAPRPYVGAEAEIQPIPMIEFSSGRWFVQGIRAGYRFIDTDTLNFDVRARFNFSGLDPEDSPFLEGMKERSGTVEAGLGLDWTMARMLGGDFELGLRAFSDVLGRSDGIKSSVDLSWRKVYGPGRVILAPSVGMLHQNADQISYYYGVLPDEARTWRPAYAGDDAWNPRASLLLLYRFSPRWTLTALASVDFFSESITESPIIDQDRELFALFGISYSL